MKRETKTFLGLGSAILMTDPWGNKSLQIDSLYCPESYVIETDKGMSMAENYLKLDRDLYSGPGGQVLPLMERTTKFAAIAERAAAFEQGRRRA